MSSTKNLWISYEMGVGHSVTYNALLELSEFENLYLEQKIMEVWHKDTPPDEFWAIKLFPHTDEIALALATEEQKKLKKQERIYKVMKKDIPTIIMDTQVVSILLDMNRFIPTSMTPPALEETYKIMPDKAVEHLNKHHAYLPVSYLRAKLTNAESCHAKLGIVPNQRLALRVLLYYCGSFYGYISVYHVTDENIFQLASIMAALNVEPIPPDVES